MKTPLPFDGFGKLFIILTVIVFAAMVTVTVGILYKGPKYPMPHRFNHTLNIKK